MKKKKRKFWFKLFVFFSLLGVAAVVFCVSAFFAITYSTTLDTTKFSSLAKSSTVILDAGGNESGLQQLSGQNKYVSFSQIPEHTINAFVAVEDKRFFKHHGIDFIRIAGAIKNNLFSSHKQGGSTITQQVIKNTQLSSEKTIERKLKEFKLAYKLEKQFSKQEILEIYLNSIYFGNGCYGIANASEYYFNKPVSELSIAESALLASTINAPSIYDPVANPQRAFERKDLVLKLMLENNKLDEETFKNCKNDPITIEKTHKNYKNQYYKGVLAEACKILKLTENQLLSQGFVLHTYYDADIQKQLEKQIVSGGYTAESKNAKLGCIVLDNKNRSVVALAANCSQNLLTTYRQPGSVIKPILVYAPAFESGKYSPASFVDDSKVCINGYSPENAGKTYSGMVSVRESIKRSLNVPAVKILDNLGLENCKNFARGLGISFDKNDNNLALALGGFTVGTTIKQLADGYMCFANGGNFETSDFIKEILLNGKVVYSRENNSRQVCSEATSYLISSCLKDVATSGTAKRLNSLNIPIYSKTGTVGTSAGNSDAYNISYTNKNTVCCWIGSNDNTSYLPSSVSGATYPTLFNKELFKNIYSGQNIAEIAAPDSVEFVGLNEDALVEYKLEADETSPVLEVFASKFKPKLTTRTELDTELVINNYKNCCPEIKFTAKRQNLYKIYRLQGANLQFLKSVQYTDGDVKFIDNTAKSGSVYEYWIEVSNDCNTKTSNHIKLVAS